MKRIDSELRELLPEIKKNISLKNYTTFKIGGRAKYFFVVKEKEDLIRAISVARKFKLPFFILGGGSKVLVADQGFEGMVIKIQNSKFEIRKSKIVTEAGTRLGQLINAAIDKKLTGLEWAIGIPGTVGGAIRGNAGAFGRSMEDVVKLVEVLDTRDYKILNSRSQIPNSKFKTKIFNNKDCFFGYRDSIFKRNPNLIILSSELKLKKGEKKEIQEKIKEFILLRKENQPLNFPSAGSIFKNPPGFSTGELIEKCNLKGKRMGKVKISEKHANFIVNLGGGKAKHVKKLTNLIKKEVKKKFKINLEKEIQYL